MFAQQQLETATEERSVCVVQKEEFDERPSIFIRDKPMFSSEGMLHKDYYRKGSVEKIYLVASLKGLDGKTN
jgi:hypothetical protein